MTDGPQTSHSPAAIRLVQVLQEAYDSNWKARYLVVVRGLPGSGKSTLSRFLVKGISNGVVASTDDHLLDSSMSFMPIYRSNNEAEAIAACKQKVWSAIQSGIQTVVVDSLHLTASDVEPYVMEAVKHNYSVHLVEPNTPWRFNPSKLCRRTSRSYTVEQIQQMLLEFDRRLTAETLVRYAQARLEQFQLSMTPTTISSVGREPIPYFANVIDEVVVEPVSGATLVTTEDEDFYSIADERSVSLRSGAVSSDTSDSESTKTPTAPPILSASTLNVDGPSELPTEDPVDQLVAIFPSVSRNQIREYLDLTNGDTEWASSFILDAFQSGTVAPVSPDDPPSPDMLPTIPSEVSNLNLQREAPFESGEVLNTTEILNFEPTGLLGLPSESECYMPTDLSHPDDDMGNPLNNSSGFRVTRDFIQHAHDIFGYALGLSGVNLTQDAVPDCLFSEWTPEPELMRTIYESFMRSLGVLQAHSGQSRRSSTQHGASSNRSRGGRNGARRAVYTDKASSFSSIMQQEQALHQSVEDFRLSLNVPVVRLIINRLKNKFPGIQHSTVEDVFVRCNFNESEAEKHLISTFTVVPAVAENGCANNETRQSLVDATDLTGAEKPENNDLSLQEIQDEEEALHRSVEDQHSQLRCLSSQLALCRLQSQFPGIQTRQLRSLFVQHDFDEGNVADQLTKDGFTRHAVAPLINHEETQSGEEAPTDQHINESDDPEIVAVKICELRQRISHIRQRLADRPDKRVISYYSSELNRLYRKLRLLTLQRGEYMVKARSTEQKRYWLEQGDADTVAAAKAMAYLDLHGLDKQCALAILRRRLSVLENRLRLNTLGTSGRSVNSCVIVITGRGGSSAADIVQTSPILRPAVMNYMQANGYEHHESYSIGSGHFTVYLPRQRKPSEA